MRGPGHSVVFQLWYLTVPNPREGNFLEKFLAGGEGAHRSYAEAAPPAETSPISALALPSLCTHTQAHTRRCAGAQAHRIPGALEKRLETLSSECLRGRQASLTATHKCLTPVCIV